MQRSIGLRSLLGGAVLIAVLSVSGCVYYDPYDPYYAPPYGYRDGGYGRGYDGYYRDYPRGNYYGDRYYRGY